MSIGEDVPAHRAATRYVRGLLAEYQQRLRSRSLPPYIIPFYQERVRGLDRELEMLFAGDNRRARAWVNIAGL